MLGNLKKDEGSGLSWGNPVRQMPIREWVGELCTGLIRQSADWIEAEQISVMLLSGTDLVVVAGQGHPIDVVGQRVKKGDGIAWKAMTHHSHVAITGVFQQYTNGNAPRFSLVMPIRLNDKPIGTLNLAKNDDGFSAREHSWARIFAWLIGHLVESRLRFLLAEAFGTDTREVRYWSQDRLEKHLGREDSSLRQSMFMTAYACSNTSKTNLNLMHEAVEAYVRRSVLMNERECRATSKTSAFG